MSVCSYWRLNFIGGRLCKMPFFRQSSAISKPLSVRTSFPLLTLSRTPHCAVMSRSDMKRMKLEHIEPEPQRNEKDDTTDRRDAEYKQKMKQQREGRKTRENNLLLADYVLVKQPRKNKWRTPYEPVFYVVCSIRGSQITARRVTDGQQFAEMPVNLS